MLAYLLFTAGLVLLLVGGDWLVKGAVGLAEKLEIPPLIIGLTIVALGTSAPELLISLEAAIAGSGGLAVGNVVGSNISNVLMVLGIPALITAMQCRDRGLGSSLIFLIALTGVFMLQMYWGPITRLDGLVLLLFLTAFLALQFYRAKQHRDDADEEEDYHDEIGAVPAKGRIIAMLLIAGLIALPVGAGLMVNSAVDIAQQWHVPEAVIGLTIVAIGTSLPELATGIMAARQGNTSVAVGNVIGSNIFNIAAIMGITATIIPVAAGSHILNFDMWIMLATTLLLVAIPISGLVIGRKLGATMLVAYCAYIFGTILL